MDEIESTRDGCYLICPYCGFKHGDAWEISTDDNDHLFECDGCKKTFTMRREVSVDYIGMPLELNP